MKKGINAVIYSVLALVVLFGNISIINFIINDKKVMYMAESTATPKVMPTETPEISYHILVKELPVFQYNTVLENKAKDARMGKYVYGDKIQIKEEGEIYTQVTDGSYVWSNCIGNLSETDSLSFPEPKVVVVDVGNPQKINEETETTELNSGLDEDTLNIAIAEKVKEKLEEYGYIVVMTWKKDDIGITDEDRAKMANMIKADAMVSIHCGSDVNKKKNGVTVYCSTKDNLYIKKKKYLQNKSLAESILKAYVKETDFNNMGVQESDNYQSINYCKVPMAMIDMGYITNKKEYNKMSKEYFQDKMANGIVNGIEEYLTNLNF